MGMIGNAPYSGLISGANIVDESIGASALKDGLLSGVKNRIINGNMKISQRNGNASFTTAANGYTYLTDRYISWSDGGTTTVACVTGSSLPTGSPFQSAIKLMPQSGNTMVSVEQRIESHNIADCAGGFVTLSFWIYASNATGTTDYAQLYAPPSIDSYPSLIYGSTNPITYTNGAWVKNTITFSTSDSGMDATKGLAVTLSVRNKVGATIYITGVQLEKGSSATDFEFRPYSVELAMCQRYYEIVSGSITPAIPIFFNRYFKVVKRASPTLALKSGSLGGSDFGAGADPTTSFMAPAGTTPTGYGDFFISSSAEL